MFFRTKKEPKKGFFFTFFYVEKNYETVESFVGLSDPIQVETTGKETKYIDDYEIEM